MKYVAIDSSAALTTLHTFAGQRVDRDAGKVTGCGLILPSTSIVYSVLPPGPRCGDCFRGDA